jgi:hypothetical protein
MSEKIASRPGSQWATGKRINVKGFTQPKGFAMGASVRYHSVPTTSKTTLEKQPK